MAEKRLTRAQLHLKAICMMLMYMSWALLPFGVIAAGIVVHESGICWEAIHQPDRYIVPGKGSGERGSTYAAHCKPWLPWSVQVAIEKAWSLTPYAVILGALVVIFVVAYQAVFAEVVAKHGGEKR